jgi:hypothetical protein
VPLNNGDDRKRLYSMRAVAFYQPYGFEPMADHPHHLFLLL